MYPKLASFVASHVFDGMPVEEDWRGRALCRPGGSFQIDGDIFFGNHGYAEARELCLRCPVRASCLAYALSMPFNPPGVWGGTTASQRTTLRRKVRRCQDCGAEIPDGLKEAQYCAKHRQGASARRGSLPGVIYARR